MSTELLIELAELILKNKYFEFNDRFRKHKEDTAIGTKFASAYAIIFMAALEEEILESPIKKLWLWWRHIENELKQFIDKLNKFNPTIKFTCDYSRERIHLLDVQVILENSDISTNLYVKEADSYQYLHPPSCHPYHCVKSIPYSRALRLNRICSNNIYDNLCKQLEKWPSERNYK